LQACFEVRRLADNLIQTAAFFQVTVRSFATTDLTPKRQILIPFHGLEAITIPQAAYRTGLPETTLRRLTKKFGLGRRLPGYERPWTLSRVAVAMHLAGDREALAAYHRGIRREEIVARYYRSEGICAGHCLA